MIAGADVEKDVALAADSAKISAGPAPGPVHLAIAMAVIEKRVTSASQRIPARRAKVPAGDCGE